MLHRISGLPQELLDMIMTGLEGTTHASLFKTRRTVLHLIPRLGQNKPQAIQLKPAKPASSGPVTSLYILTTNIMEEELLSKVGFNNTKGVQSISLDNRPIYGLQFELSGLGLRAIRVLYQDNATSPWLGKTTRRGWLGKILADDLSTLCVISENFRILRVRFEPDGKANNIAKQLLESPRVSYLRSVLWSPDGDTPSNQQAIHWRAAHDHSTRVPYYKGWAICQMLSFEDPDSLTSLTIRFGELGISGIKAGSLHSSRMAGAEGKYTLHLALAQGEYLTSSWLFTRPSIIFSVTTSRGRTYHFGSGHSLESDFDASGPQRRGHQTDDKHWTCLSTTTSTKITGVVINTAFDARHRQCITRIGVAEDKRALSPEVTNSGQWPKFQTGWGGALDMWHRDRLLHLGHSLTLTDGNITSKPGFYFQTSASLVNVASIFIQKRRGVHSSDSFVMGIQITHHDGTTDTLGPRWSPKVSHHDYIREIYNSVQDGHIEQLVFLRKRHRTEPRRAHFMDVQVLTANPGSGKTSVQVFNYPGAPSPEYDFRVRPADTFCWMFGTLFFDSNGQVVPQEWSQVGLYRPSDVNYGLVLRSCELEVLV